MMKKYLITACTLLLSVIQLHTFAQRIVIEAWPDSTDKVVYEITKGTLDEPIDYYFTKYYPNGKIYREGAYVDSKATGLWKYYYQDGSLLTEGNYRRGNLVGDFISYYRSGEIAQKGLYKVGQLASIELFNKDGSTKERNENLDHLISNSATEWTPKQKGSIWIDCFMPMDGRFPNAAAFCLCMVDSVSKYVEFEDFYPLTIYQQSLLFQKMKDEKGSCGDLLNPTTDTMNPREE